MNFYKKIVMSEILYSEMEVLGENQKIREAQTT